MLECSGVGLARTSEHVMGRVERKNFVYKTCKRTGCHNLIRGRVDSIFCSGKCGAAHRYEGKKSNLEDLACGLCNKTFTPSKPTSWFCFDCREWVNRRRGPAAVIAQDRSATGVSTETQNVLWEMSRREQVDYCECCGATLPDVAQKNGRHLDHDHKTGRIRGVLCFYCNLMIGFARDNPFILRLGMLYLMRNESKVVPSNESSPRP